MMTRGSEVLTLHRTSGKAHRRTCKSKRVTAADLNNTAAGSRQLIASPPPPPPPCAFSLLHTNDLPCDVTVDVNENARKRRLGIIRNAVVVNNADKLGRRKFSG